MKSTSTARGKIILSGEYAVVFGYPGIAAPAEQSVTATYENSGASPMKIILEGNAGMEEYARRIVGLCVAKGYSKTGTMVIQNEIPLGKGMGSSTALVIALSKCLLGEEKREDALQIEDAVNPGHSGLDFAVIWSGLPMIIQRGKTPTEARVDLSFIKQSEFIDTGTPNEITAELVAWMRARVEIPEVSAALKTIGNCTERLLNGESPIAVFRDHHRAQVALGVVPKSVQELIAGIEQKGGAAKVLGAGARSGGGGMVLSLFLS
ncbi:hypothetical protein HYW84_02930 [Candidatus Peregrinibacteria bacterium]|nr:hypothetical protein [Candidatus Peregrinibacteria bacterium]